MYYEVMIRPHAAGFGMWQVEEQDLLAAMAQHVWELIELGGAEPLPEDVEDIRGRIDPEPARVFALRRSEDDAVEYVGMVERTP
jgi:hypothetical protein